MINKLIFASLLFLGGVSTATASNQPVANQKKISGFSSVVSWQSERIVNYCVRSDTSPLSCKTSIMPPWIGQVESIVQGNFVSSIRPNWLVLANEKVALCAISFSMKTVCEKVMESDDHQNFKLSFNAGALYITPSEQARQNSAERTADFTNALAPALAAASKRLYGKLGKRTVAKSKGSVPNDDDSFTIMASEDEDMPPDLEGDGTTVGAGNGGGGGSGGGCFPPLCVIIPPPIPLPPPKDPFEETLPTSPQPGGICNATGLFCNSDAEWEAEFERCRKVAASCREVCLDALPTGDWSGTPYFICYNTCQIASGCTP